jgi:hypothetical protein
MKRYIYNNKIMGTRGLFGFRYKNRYYLIYNHYDSYYSYLGVKILKEIKEAIEKGKFIEWIELFKKITIINYSNKNNYINTNSDYPICDLIDNEDEEYANYDDNNESKEEYYDINKIKIINRTPNVDDINKLSKYCDTTVGNQTTMDWYCLTRGMQGSIKKVLKSGYLLLYPEFSNITGDLFIEYSYILDFESSTLQIYTKYGFVKTINLLDIKQINDAIAYFS